MDLPAELVLHIFRFLGIKDGALAAKTSWQFHDAYSEMVCFLSS